MTDRSVTDGALSDAVTGTGAGAAETPSRPDRGVRVWDPLVRLIHWGLAATVLTNALIDDPESKLHETLGYVAVGLVVLRLLWGIIGTEHARFSAFPPNPLAALRHFGDLIRGRHSVHLSHNPAGALMVYNLWLSVIGMGVTGYMMGTVAFFGIGWVEELHEAIYVWLMASVVLHLAGVVLDSLVTRVSLVGAMIHGRKRLPGRRP